MSEEKLQTIFAKNLKYYLSQANKTQADLCKYMNVSSATASDWCNGRKMPRADKIQSIANWLGISTGSMMEEDRYYFDSKTAKTAQAIFENKELSLLFDAARDASPEDLRTVHTILLALKNKERQ